MEKEEAKPVMAGATQTAEENTHRRYKSPAVAAAAEELDNKKSQVLLLQYRLEQAQKSVDQARQKLIDIIIEERNK